jgi:hypothetical protein
LKPHAAIAPVRLTHTDRTGPPLRTTGHTAYPTLTLASSSEPWKNSESGRAPTAIAALFEIEPTAPAIVNGCPSTTSTIDDAVFVHWIVCQRPSLSAGPAISSREPAEPTKPHEACPEGWYSTLYSPPVVVKSPLRI